MNMEVGNGRVWREGLETLGRGSGYTQRATESQWHFKQVSQRKQEVFVVSFPLAAGLDKVAEDQENHRLGATSEGEKVSTFLQCPELRRWRQDDDEFKGSLGYRLRKKKGRKQERG